MKGNVYATDAHSIFGFKCFMDLLLLCSVVSQEAQKHNRLKIMIRVATRGIILAICDVAS